MSDFSNLKRRSTDMISAVDRATQATDSAFRDLRSVAEALAQLAADIEAVAVNQDGGDRGDNAGEPEGRQPEQ